MPPLEVIDRINQFLKDLVMDKKTLADLFICNVRIKMRGYVTIKVLFDVMKSIQKKPGVIDIRQNISLVRRQKFYKKFHTRKDGLRPCQVYQILYNLATKGLRNCQIMIKNWPKIIPKNEQQEKMSENIRDNSKMYRPNRMEQGGQDNMEDELKQQAEENMEDGNSKFQQSPKLGKKVQESHIFNVRDQRIKKLNNNQVPIAGFYQLFQGYYQKFENKQCNEACSNNIQNVLDFISRLSAREKQQQNEDSQI